MEQYTLIQIKEFRKKGKVNPLVKYYDKSLIYKFEVNNKVYIGQTRNLASRLKSYLNSKNNSQLISRAISKYPEKVTFSIVEICENQHLNRQEIFWIEYYKSFDRSLGYNLTTGGNVETSFSRDTILKMEISAKNKKTVSLYTLDGSLVNTFQSVRACAKELNLKACTIFSSLKNHHVLNKKYISYYGNLEKVEPYKGRNVKAISNAMRSNKNCIKYLWEASFEDRNYCADSLRELSVKMGLKEEFVRSIAYNRSKSKNIMIKKTRLRS